MNGRHRNRARVRVGRFRWVNVRVYEVPGFGVVVSCNRPLDVPTAVRVRQWFEGES